MKRRVVITGLGVVAPNAVGIKDFEDALRTGRSGLGPITRFDATGFKVKTVGEIKNFDPVDFMPIAVVRKTDRFVHLGVAAAKMALTDSHIEAGQAILKPATVIIGSGLGGALFHEETIIDIVRSGDIRSAAASAVPRITPNAVSAYIALHFGITGLNQVISTACSSSAHAIGESFHKVRRGDVDLAITGGAEATISLVNIGMYQAMQVLGSSMTDVHENASRPFDATRNGFVMGEGAACLVLESLEHARARNAKIYAEIVGYGANCGAYHMVAPNPTGEDAAAVMKMAVDDSGLALTDIDYINAHGTSTKHNDISETRAIKLLFSERAKKIPVSSIKSTTGHTIGAAGAIEAVASCLALYAKFIPPTMNLNNPDSECDLDYVPNKMREAELRAVLSNSFGFGSNNAALVFKKWED